MPLPNDDDLKTYLRIETDDEDVSLFDIVEEATAQAETLIRRPILATQKTLVGIAGTDAFSRPIIRFRPYPIASVPAPVMTNSEGDVVDASDYVLRGDTGLFTAASGISFSYSPYQIVASVGLQFHSEYERRLLPMCRTLILALGSEIYHERNPGASSESESGDSVSYYRAGAVDEESLPPRLLRIVRSLRPIRV